MNLLFWKLYKKYEFSIGKYIYVINELTLTKFALF